MRIPEEKINRIRNQSFGFAKLLLFGLRFKFQTIQVSLAKVKVCYARDPDGIAETARNETAGEHG